MATVYGIYIDGIEDPVYVGRTKYFQSRKHNHYALARIKLRKCLERGEFIDSRFELKALIMQMGRMGDIGISIDPIYVGDHREAERIERRMIARYKCPLNTWHPTKAMHLNPKHA